MAAGGLTCTPLLIVKFPLSIRFSALSAPPVMLKTPPAASVSGPVTFNFPFEIATDEELDPQTVMPPLTSSPT